MFIPFIYKIVNDINGKLYIGKTSHKSIEKRFNEHKRDCRKKRCEKRPLYDAMNKYGIENFRIEQIEAVETEEEACEREKYWIQHYQAYVGFKNCNGYNATLGGDGKRYKNYEEIAEKYLELGTIKETAKVMKCDTQTVVNACEEFGIPRVTKKNTISIERVDNCGFSKKFESISSAANETFPAIKIKTATSCISSAAKRGGTYKGYFWIYLN